jgi:hypothetical protein
MSVKISQRLVVEYDQNGHWVPEVRDVGGIAFCRLQKWDRHFIRFAKASALNLAKASESNIGIVDVLRRLRNASCDKALSELDGGGNHDGSGGRKKRKYQRKANSQDILVLPAHLEITLPDVIVADGVVAGFTVKVLAEGVRSTTLYIEITPEVLEYIRTVTLHSSISGRSWRKKVDNRRHEEQEDNAPQGPNSRSHSRSSNE